MQSIALCQARSAHDLQKDAEAAVADGANAEALAPISLAGSGGTNAENVSRELMNRARRDLAIPLQPYPADVCVTLKTSPWVANRTASIILPHELDHEIANDPTWFEEVFGTPEDWTEFWVRVENEVWFQAHPHKERILAHRHLSVPIVLYGDEAPLDKNQKTCSTRATVVWCNVQCVYPTPTMSKTGED